MDNKGGAFQCDHCGKFYFIGELRRHKKYLERKSTTKESK